MKLKVGYIETFPVLGGWQKIPLEAEIESEIDLLNCTDEELDNHMKAVRRVQYAFKKQVQTFFYESNAAAQKQLSSVADNQIVPVVEVKKTPVEGMVDAIMGCSSLKVLETFKKLSENKPEFKVAYDETFKKLSNGL